MKTTIKRLNEEENEVLSKLDESIESLQKEIDELLEIFTKLKQPLDEVKEQIKEKRQKLAPISELKASICSPMSRDKYYPEETKKSILELAKKAI